MIRSTPKKHAPRRRRASKATRPPAGVTAFLAWFGKERSDLTLQKGDNAFHQGEPADAVFYVQSGKIEVVVTSKQGKTAIVALVGAGDFFGEACLTGQTVRTASARAVAPATIIRIAKASMQRQMRERPDLSGVLTNYLLSRNVQVESDLVDQMFNSSERRLARLLLLLANFEKEGEMDPVLPRISQDTLAARIGTTRSRISYFMNKFRRLGYIEYNGTLKVRTSLLNVVLND